VKADEETRQALNYLRETILDLFEEKDAEITALRESKESLEMDLEHAEREVELLKLKLEQVYSEAA
jgi:chromosome segregation ATPase